MASASRMTSTPPDELVELTAVECTRRVSCQNHIPFRGVPRSTPCDSWRSKFHLPQIGDSLLPGPFGKYWAERCFKQPQSSEARRRVMQSSNRGAAICALRDRSARLVGSSRLHMPSCKILQRLLHTATIPVSGSVPRTLRAAGRQIDF